MAFYDYSTDQTQRINLSEQSLMTIESDIIAFCENKSMGFFLNRIFKNFKDNAQASISIMIAKERQQMDAYLKREKLTELEKKFAVDTFISYLENKLISAKVNPKGRSVKFRINDENIRYLTETGTECQEDIYYFRLHNSKEKRPRIGLYLNALFEEYAEKPLHQREKIYFAEEFDLIEWAINKCQIKVQVASGSVYFVKPFSIELATYHYLTGISMPAEAKDGARQMNAAFRISGIADNMRMLRSRTGYLTEHEKMLLKKEIREKGAQFLTDSISDIKIKLTETGVQNYKRQLHLRPKLEAVLPGNIYCFKCTELQAEYYFIKFGADARVLEPETLARRFAKVYSEADRVYRNDNDNSANHN